MYAARQRIMVMIGGSFLLSSVVIFFGFHIFAGERGILARPELDRKIMLAEEKLDLLDKQHNFLSRRIKLLQADSLDADMLAETARAEHFSFSESYTIFRANSCLVGYIEVCEAGRVHPFELS